MSMKDALDLVPDNVGEAAQIALAAEFAGIDYEDAFDELAGSKGCPPPAPRAGKVWMADDARKRLKKAKHTVQEFVITHWRINGIADFWPTTGRWKFLDGSAQGRDLESLLKQLKAALK